MHNEYAHLDATAQAELIPRGEAAQIELVDTAIGRIKQLNPKLKRILLLLQGSVETCCGAQLYIQ